MKMKPYIYAAILFLVFGQKIIHQIFELLKPLYFNTFYRENYKVDGSGVGYNVLKIICPKNIAEVISAVKQYKHITFGGAMYSCGAQTLSSDAVLLHTKNMNNVIGYDATKKTVKVEGGATWEDLIRFLDRKNMSVHTMQSYRNFSIGGSISVNVHGRCARSNPLVASVLELTLVLADGRVFSASRSNNSELFFAAVGGYGLLGCIVDATLRVKENIRLELSKTKLIKAEDYFSYHKSQIFADKEVILNNADLYPPDYNTVRVITWKKSSKPLTEPRRMESASYPNILIQQLYYWASDSWLGSYVRQKLDEYVYSPTVATYNYATSSDVSSLTPMRYLLQRYVLQEFFIPVAQAPKFLTEMKGILQKHDVKVLNISIRHVSADNETVMSWARQDCFCFVLYYRQTCKEKEVVYSRFLIEKAIEYNGCFYLPYQNFATKSQVQRAYPNVDKFRAIKKKYDPTGKFSSEFAKTYEL